MSENHVGGPLKFRPRMVRIIVLKELLESLRDRRTLFMMIFLPVLLYPALFLVLTQVMSLQKERLEASASRIGFDTAELAAHPELASFLETDDALELQPLPANYDEPSLHALMTSDADDAPHAVVRIAPPDDAAGLDLDAGTVSVRILHVSIEERSRFAADRLERRLEAWATAEVGRRLESRGLPRSLADPLASVREDLSGSAQRGGFVLASILPMFVVITVLLGAFYPAIDLTAGEKERGSIQTLFAAPISVLEIVAGKYLAVVAIALISGLANLASMGLMFGYLGRTLGEGTIEIGFDAGTVAVLLLVIVLVAVFFAALVMAVAVLARDFKDAQNLSTPVFLLALVPGMIAQMPGFELTPALAMVPGVNVILLMKQALVYGVVVENLFLVTVSSLVTTLLALVVATRLFSQERVIVGERGRFDILARPSQIRPRLRPEPAEGLAWFAVMFVLLFYLGAWVQGRDLLSGLLVTLWLLLLAPTLGLARYLKLSLRETFGLRRPPPRTLLAALIMGPTTWTVVEALNRLVEVVLPTPPSMVEGMDRLLAVPGEGSVLGWVYLLFVLAVTPGVCEELLFRGFLFSSLRDRLRPWTVILVTSVMFGAFHLSIYRLFGTTALGIVMGILAYQARSIVPSMLFHALNNATALLLAHTVLSGREHTPWWLLAVGGPATLLGLYLLGTGAAAASSAQRA